MSTCRMQCYIFLTICSIITTTFSSSVLLFTKDVGNKKKAVCMTESDSRDDALTFRVPLNQVQNTPVSEYDLEEHQINCNFEENSACTKRYKQKTGVGVVSSRKYDFVPVFDERWESLRTFWGNPSFIVMTINTSVAVSIRSDAQGILVEMLEKTGAMKFLGEIIGGDRDPKYDENSQWRHYSFQWVQDSANWLIIYEFKDSRYRILAQIPYPLDSNDNCVILTHQNGSNFQLKRHEYNILEVFDDTEILKFEAQSTGPTCISMFVTCTNCSIVLQDAQNGISVKQDFKDPDLYNYLPTFVSWKKMRIKMNVIAGRKYVLKFKHDSSSSLNAIDDIRICSVDDLRMITISNIQTKNITCESIFDSSKGITNMEVNNEYEPCDDPRYLGPTCEIPYHSLVEKKFGKSSYTICQRDKQGRRQCVCSPGYTGNNCRQDCSPGFYGYNCLSKCGNCLGGNINCASDLGICKYGCQTGYSGLHCKPLTTSPILELRQPVNLCSPPLNPYEKSRKINCMYKNQEIDCNQPAPEGSTKTINCVSYKQPNFPVSTCKEGKWDFEIKCVERCGWYRYGRMKRSLSHLEIPFTDREKKHDVHHVVRGFEAFPDEFPWNVGLHERTGNMTQHICGGTIIHPKIIVSAAHCFKEYDKLTPVDPKKYLVSVHNFLRNDISKSYQVKHVFIPKDYMGYLTNYMHDIAVLVLEPAISIRTIVPACIDWMKTSEDEELYAGNLGKLAGWGKLSEFGEASDKLQYLKVPYVPRDKCFDILPEEFYAFMTQDKFCAGYTNGSALCEGDSGGGLVFATNFYHTLRGVASLGPTKTDSCDSHQVTAYTRVTDHVEFIGEVYIKYGLNDINK